MRMKCFCLVVIGLAMISASPVFADDYSQLRDYWQWEFVSCTPDHQSTSPSRVILGFKPLATDGWDGEPLIETADGPAVSMAAYHTDWPGQSGFYKEDFRAPLLPGETKSWTLYMWATPDVPNTCESIELVMSNTMPMPPDAYDLQFHLTLKAKPNSVTGGPDIGTVWNLDYPGATGFSLPIYRTDNGLSGYQFELTATAVPEPSAFVVLTCGLVGILTRTRKRRTL